MTEGPDLGGTRRWLRTAWAVFCFAGLAAAMDPNRGLSQYLRDRWSVEQGFPGGKVYAIAGTADGYLWIGAEKGLIRFDGLNFHLFNHVNSPTLPAGPVLDLAASPDGDLWIRMESPGVLRYRGGVFQNASTEFAQMKLPITAMSRQKRGELLFATLSDITLKYSDGKLVQRRFKTGQSNFFVASIAETSDGQIWLGTLDMGLFSLGEGDDAAVPRGLEGRRINCLLPAGDKGLWIGTDTGLIRWDGTKIVDAGVVRSVGRIKVLSVAEDRDSNVWVGTADGLKRINAGGVSSLDRRGGMPLTALFEDREGNLWTGDAQGIERFRDSVFLSYSTARVRRSGDSGPLYADGEDRIWFAPSDGGLFWLRGSHIGRVEAAGLNHDPVYSISGGAGELWVGRQRGGLTHLVEAGGSFAARTYTHADGLAQDTVYTVYRSRDGSVWAGTLNGGVSRFRNGRFTNYTSANGLASDSVSSILEGSDGTMWFATANGLNAFSNDRWRVYTGREGLPSGHVNCLLQDSHGVLWIGTSEGLAFLRSDRVHIPSSAPGTLREEIFGVAEDASGWLWITTSAHVLRVERDKLLNVESGDGDLREYGPRDGLLSTEGVKRDRSVTADSHGRIWFSTNGGIYVVDPARLTRRPVPATVHIQTVSAGGSLVNMAHAVRIPAISQRIIFSYTGLSLSAPERVKYRYMLDGLDRAWSAPTATTEAGYSNLRPGPYRFRVIASAADGQWDGAEAALPFEIEPMFWQTWWFFVAVTLACGLAIYALYRYRMHQLTWQLNLRFEERLAERARVAQELHDTLLQGFLSASMQLQVMADRLPEESPVRPPLSRIIELMRCVIDEGRNTLRGLRLSRTSSLDLEQAFSRIEQELGVEDEIGFRVIVEGQRRPLRPVLRDEVYRIGREAVVNAFRHARARSIEVEVEYSPRQFRVLVRDDGCGIDPQVLQSGRDGHWGLPGMREGAERMGGRLRVWSRVTSGTEVELSVPGDIAFESASSSRSRRWFGWYARRPRASQRVEPRVAEARKPEN